MATYTPDAVVRGQTDRAIMFACALAKKDVNVALIEGQDAFGGETCCGLAGWDGTGGMNGMPLEYRTEIGLRYGPDVGPTVNGAPHDAAAALNTLLDRYGVTRLAGDFAPFSAANFTGRRISKVETTAGDTINLPRWGVCSDGSYDGDFLRAGGAQIVWGREAQSAREPLAGFGVLRKQRTQSPFVGGVSANGLKPGILQYPDGRRIGSADYGPYSIQGWNFRTPIMALEDGGVDMTSPPPDYDRTRYFVLNDSYSRTTFTPHFTKTYAYNGQNVLLPKYYDTNIFDIPGIDKAAWVNGDKETRDAIYLYAKNWWLGWWWFMRTDLDVWEPRRLWFQTLGLCPDEFPDNDHIPYHLYMRQTGRLVSKLTLMQDDCQINPFKDDVIAFGQLSLDQHVHAYYANALGSRANGYILEGTMGSIAGEAKIYTDSLGRGYHIPWRSFVPAGGATNMLSCGIVQGVSAVAGASTRSTGTGLCAAQGVAEGAYIYIRTKKTLGSIGEDVAATVAQYY